MDEILAGTNKSKGSILGSSSHGFKKNVAISSKARETSNDSSHKKSLSSSTIGQGRFGKSDKGKILNQNKKGPGN